jgi:hypothetical protein
MYFVPIYIWGIESLAHAHWWAFRASFRGIAPNLLWIGAEQGVYSLGVLGMTAAACILAEYFAARTGMRTRAGRGTVPLPVVAGVSAVGMAWYCLLLFFVWAFFTAPPVRS